MSGRAPLQRGAAPGIERPDGIADRLIVAAQRFGDHAGCLATGTGQQDLTAPQDKGIGRPQPLLQGVLFARGQRTDINVSLFRLNHRLPRGEAHPEVVQGTAEFHHDITDTLLPQTEAVFDNATTLHAAVDMLDP